MDKVECVVVGAGVVGLAVARRLALAGIEVIVLEREATIGTVISSRNSEVIHAGIYYPTGSLKARLCVAGKLALYRYCAERGVEHQRCGKLIVATSEKQRETLAGIHKKANENGVDDIEDWSAERAISLEPSLRCTGALWSPSTGIIDSHGLMLAYQGDAEDHGAFVAFNAPLERAAIKNDGFELTVGGEAPMRLQTNILVNSTGLDAPKIASTMEGLNGTTMPKGYLCKGNYYTLAGRSPFSRLIYPVPEAHGLGVHVTVDLAGNCRFGPDTEWVDDLDYEVDPARAGVFYDAIRTYWPDLPDNMLEPGYSGIRPKLTPMGAPPSDFVVQGPQTHGIAGLVNLLGIESPGLTASPAIADEVALRLAIGSGDLRKPQI